MIEFGLLIDVAVIAVCIAGIQQFRTPRGARLGNFLAASAMLCALLLVLYRHGIVDPGIVFALLLIGALSGYAVSQRVTMLQIPSLVALQNGMGGLASLLVALVELLRSTQALGRMNEIAGLLGITLGALTFSGSLIAAAKLSGKMRQTPHLFPAHSLLTLANLAILLIIVIAVLAGPLEYRLYLLVSQIALAAFFGVLFAIRIGGADMPVLISFLNATTGLAAAFCGIVIENQLLIAFGAMVGASGSILTYAMCTAMNRSLLRVFVPHTARKKEPDDAIDNGRTALKLQPEPPGRDLHAQLSAQQEGQTAQKPVGESQVIAAANLLVSARKVVVIPGYGMAIAQAQHKVVELSAILEEMGKQIVFAIHPVAGRMPGHMNVLLAEADVDYDALVEMEKINPDFPQTDVALIFGACDVVNPAAIAAEGTPISGMPILLAHEAKSIVICNYDKKPGYSGVENPLYENDKAIFLPGDAQQTAGDLILAMQRLRR